MLPSWWTISTGITNFTCGVCSLCVGLFKIHLFIFYGFLERVNTNRPAAHINDPRFKFDFTFSCMLRTQRVPSLSTMIASVFDLTVTKCMTRLNRSVKSESGAKHEELMLQQKQVRHVDERCWVRVVGTFWVKVPLSVEKKLLLLISFL